MQEAPVRVEEGQSYVAKGARRVATTAIRGEEQGFWISTIRLNERPNRPYETLVFPLPSESVVVRDQGGDSVFDPIPELRETFQAGFGNFNRTNMLSRSTALRHHTTTVQAVTNFLSGGTGHLGEQLGNDVSAGQRQVNAALHKKQIRGY